MICVQIKSKLEKHPFTNFDYDKHKNWKINKIETKDTCCLPVFTFDKLKKEGKRKTILI